MTTQYLASDQTVFSSEQDCLDHEKELSQHICYFVVTHNPVNCEEGLGWSRDTYYRVHVGAPHWDDALMEDYCHKLYGPRIIVHPKIGVTLSWFLKASTRHLWERARSERTDENDYRVQLKAPKVLKLHENGAELI